MPDFLFNLAVLAQSNRFESMGNRFRGRSAQFESGDIWTGLAILVAACVALYVLSRFLSRHDRHRAFNSPRALFRELCQAHGLDRPSRKLLKQMARWQRLEQPARLFLEPDRFDQVNLSPQLKSRLSEVQMVRDRVFAQTLDLSTGMDRKQRSWLGKLIGTRKTRKPAGPQEKAPAEAPSGANPAPA